MLIESFITHMTHNNLAVSDAILGRLTQSTSTLERMSLSIDGSHLMLIESFITHMTHNNLAVSDAILGRLTQSTSTLERMSLSIDGSHLMLIESFITHMTHNNLAVSTAGWHAAAERFPQLRVLVDLRGRYRLMDFQSVLDFCFLGCGQGSDER